MPSRRCAAVSRADDRPFEVRGECHGLSVRRGVEGQSTWSRGVVCIVSRNPSEDERSERYPFVACWRSGAVSMRMKEGLPCLPSGVFLARHASRTVWRNEQGHAIDPAIK